MDYPEKNNTPQGTEVLLRINQIFGAVVLIPVPLKAKGPTLKGWPELTYEQTQTDEYKAMLEEAIRRGGNLGILLGSASGVIGIDIDCDDEIAGFLSLNPRLVDTMQTHGAVGRCFWVRLIGEYPERRICAQKKVPGHNKAVAEFRGGGGAQCIIWGLHPSGHRYIWLKEAPPVEIRFEDIKWPADWGMDFGSNGTEPLKEHRSFKPALADPIELGSIDAEALTHIDLVCQNWAAPELSASQLLACLSRFYNLRCQPPWTLTELKHKVTDAIKLAAQGQIDSQAQSDQSASSSEAQRAKAQKRKTDKTGTYTHESNREDFQDFNEYPEINSEAFYGIGGQITHIIDPHTEADPVAILIQLLIAAGCAIGHQPYFAVGATQHFANLHTCLVGRTSKGRKGSALDFIVWVMREVDCPWVGTCLTSGLSSGEGLIYAVRDQLIKKEQVKKAGKYTGEIQQCIADFGVEDKRLFVTEPEFSRPLKAMNRESNILSEVIRSSWDHGNLRSMVRNNPYKATGAHISIVGHITREELHKSLLECDFFNGFANRFLWLCVQRSKILPFGGSIVLSDLSPEIDHLKATIAWAREVVEMERDQEADQLWAEVYGELTADIPGRFGAAIGRGEGQVLRLSMLYALLDKSQTIRSEHLKAALALWQYCVDSARYLFLNSFDNPHALKILSALRQRPKGMTRTEINVEVFGRNLIKTKMNEALHYLRRINLAYNSTEHTAGRPSERWFACSKNKEAEDYD
jgi:hypothetical protein